MGVHNYTSFTSMRHSLASQQLVDDTPKMLRRPKQPPGGPSAPASSSRPCVSRKPLRLQCRRNKLWLRSDKLEGRPRWRSWDSSSPLPATQLARAPGHVEMRGVGGRTARRNDAVPRGEGVGVVVLVVAVVGVIVVVVASRDEDTGTPLLCGGGVLRRFSSLAVKPTLFSGGEGTTFFSHHL